MQSPGGWPKGRADHNAEQSISPANIPCTGETVFLALSLFYLYIVYVMHCSSSVFIPSLQAYFAHTEVPHDVQVRQGMLWIWPESGADAWLEASATPPDTVAEMEDPSFAGSEGSFSWMENPASNLVMLVWADATLLYMRSILFLCSLARLYLSAFELCVPYSRLLRP